MGTTRAVAEAKTDGGPPICDKALRARPVHISGIDDERAHEPPHRVSDVVAPDHPFDALDAYICPSKALRVGRFSSVANALVLGASPPHLLPASPASTRIAAV